MHKWPKEVVDWLRVNTPGRTTKELVALIKREPFEQCYGMTFTEASIKCAKHRYGFRSGTPTGNRKGALCKYPQDMLGFIRDVAPGRSNAEICRMVNERFGINFTLEQCKSFKANHKITSGLTGWFEKGHVPANKGKHMETRGRMAETQFKKRHLPHNTKPIGWERVSRDGYIEVKVRMRPSDPLCNDNFKPKHRLIWEAANGPIPEGHVLIFKDGDKTNLALENLALVSKAENAMLNRRGLRFNDANLTETGIAVAKVLASTFSKKKKGATKE